MWELNKLSMYFLFHVFVTNEAFRIMFRYSLKAPHNLHTDIRKFRFANCQQILYISHGHVKNHIYYAEMQLA